jgi:DNA polymerase-1
MAAQLPRIHEAVEALRIPLIMQDGYEADDIIATLARQAAAAGSVVYIVTSDKDLFQLVDDNVRIYLPQKGSEPPIVLDREGVKAKLGVYPEKVIDLLALTGDTSDNIPGIPGIGPKTALALLEEFGDVDTVLAKAETISAKGVRAKVTENLEAAKLSKTLVTIDTAVPVAVEFKDLIRRELDAEECRRLFMDLEFYSLLKQIMGGHSAGETETSHVQEKYVRVGSAAELEKLAAKLSKLKEIAFDTETDALDPVRANLVGISLCGKAGESYYIPVGHTEAPDLNIPRDAVRELLAPLMNNPAVQKIAQNFKFDFHIMKRAGYAIAPISFDTMLASYVLNPSARGHNLDTMALEHLGHRMIAITDLIGSGKKQKSFATVHPDTAARYSAEDADYTFRLRGILAPKIEEMKLAPLYYDIELPLIPVLARMEKIGVKIDTVFLKKLSVQMEEESRTIENGIYAMAGQEFNINSTQQLGKILFDQLKLPTKGKTTKKTAFSTDVRVLEELSKIHPFPLAILEYRRLSKLRSTYVDALPELVNPETGRVHTSFNQAVAATGRLSSSDPNLQNIPVRTESGREIRKAFIPTDDDYTLLTADYSQIELRILAHYAEDAGLLAAFKAGEDIHARTAAEVFGVPLNNVTSAQRRVAKTANFAIIYGVSAYGLSQQTDMDVPTAQDFINTYFARYPGIKRYIDATLAGARRDGFVNTLSGRRRYLPDINSKNFQLRQFAERTAINMPIQGTAADMIKMAMIRIDKALLSMKTRMVLQVHDELVFDTHRDEVAKVSTLVRKEMTEALKLRAPLTVDMGTGPNWLEAK